MADHSRDLVGIVGGIFTLSGFFWSGVEMSFGIKTGRNVLAVTVPIAVIGIACVAYAFHCL